MYSILLSKVEHSYHLIEDRLKELIKKYNNQLQLYKKALESSLNKKVDKVYIYSTYLGKEIKI